MKTWMNYKPIFEFDDPTSLLNKLEPNLGQFEILYDFTRNLKPKMIVTLGNTFGGSSFSFCQASKDVNSKTLVSIIDTWNKNENMFAPGAIWQVEQIVDNVYPMNAKILKGQINEMFDQFEHDSIDFLYIECQKKGMNPKETYNKWTQKLASNGAVILNYINHDLETSNFANELIKTTPNLAFLNYEDLIIVFPKGVNAGLPSSLDDTQQIIYNDATFTLLEHLIIEEATSKEETSTFEKNFDLKNDRKQTHIQIPKDIVHIDKECHLKEISIPENVMLLEIKEDLCIITHDILNKDEKFTLCKLMKCLGLKIDDTQHLVFITRANRVNTYQKLHLLLTDQNQSLLYANFILQLLSVAQTGVNIIYTENELRSSRK